MSEPTNTLEPTLDEIRDVLGPLRPEPEEFADGVAERVADRTAERESRDERVVSSWPRWLRRAALIAPAGSVKALTMLKAAPGAKAGGAAAGTTLAAPLAAVAMGLLGIFAATFRLDAGRDSDSDRGIDRQNIAGLGWAVLGAATVVMLFGLVRHPALVPPVVGLLQVSATILVIRVLSALGRASRATIAAVLAALFLEIGTFQMFLLPSVHYGDRLLPSVLFGVGAIGLYAIARASGWKGAGRAQFVVQSTIFAGAATFYFVTVAPVPFGGSARAITTWANRVEPDIDSLSGWENLGRVAVAFSDTELEAVDRERLARIYHAGVPKKKYGVHPVVFGGGFRLGIVEPSDIEDYVDAGWYRRPRFSPTPFTYHGKVRAHIVDAQARGIFEGKLREDARIQLAVTWPKPGAFQSLEKAADVLEVAEIAGFEDLIVERLPRVPDILEAAWVGRRVAPFAKAGFEALNRDRETGELGDPRYTASTSSSFHAARLIAVLAERDPEALETLDVDLRSFIEYLDEERERSRMHSLHPYQVEAALARHLLLRSVELPPRELGTWLPRNGLVLGALASLLLAFAGVIGAPRGRATWDGPEEGR